jgi:hypothetical protein
VQIRVSRNTLSAQGSLSELQRVTQGVGYLGITVGDGVGFDIGDEGSQQTDALENALRWA